MSDIPAVLDIQDVTTLSKVIACNTEYYANPDRDKTDDPYTLFIVNNGTTNGETPFVDFYYGENKLSQIIVTETLPIPGVDQKVYIKSKDSTGTGGEPAGIYLYLADTGKYLCLTSLAENGNISSVAQETIIQDLYDKILQNYMKPTWKKLK